MIRCVWIPVLVLLLASCGSVVVDGAGGCTPGEVHDAAPDVPHVSPPDACHPGLYLACPSTDACIEYGSCCKPSQYGCLAWCEACCEVDGGAALHCSL